jgi:hypothetical protein
VNKTINRRHFFTVAAGTFVAGALAVVTVKPTWAQSDESADFVPGEILIGVNSPQDRDAVVRQIEAGGQRYRTGNDIAGMAVEKSGNSGLRLKVEFSDSVKGRLRGDPNAELGLLQNLAQQIKANNPGVSYAHPNWITRVDPVERLGSGLQNRL